MGTPAPSRAPMPLIDCRAREVLARVGDKWSLYVIHLLGDRSRRFTELRRSIDGISQRMLTVTLRGLERDGLVTRTVYPTVPPRVDYALTPMGRTLLDTVCALVHWAEKHLDEIHAARATYDQRVARLGASLSGDSGDAADARGHRRAEDRATT